MKCTLEITQSSECEYDGEMYDSKQTIVLEADMTDPLIDLVDAILELDPNITFVVRIDKDEENKK